MNAHSRYAAFYCANVFYFNLMKTHLNSRQSAIYVFFCTIIEEIFARICIFLECLKAATAVV